MRLFIFWLLLFFLFSSTASADDGLITIKSSFSVDKTVARLQASLKSKGMTLFASISHSDGAMQVGKQLRPTELVIFGNPKVGTLLMQCRQSVAIDLPQKALIWEDEEGQVWFSYNDPRYLARRHNIKHCNGMINKISGVLAQFATAATDE